MSGFDRVDDHIRTGRTFLSTRPYCTRWFCMPTALCMNPASESYGAHGPRPVSPPCATPHGRFSQSIFRVLAETIMTRCCMDTETGYLVPVLSFRRGGSREAEADVTPYALCMEKGLCLQKPRPSSDRAPSSLDSTSRL